MTNETILAVLKFSGPIVGLVSALWSTTQKITYEDEAGVKRLTFQGRALMGIVVISALISILALGFESIIGEQQAQQAATAKAEDERRAAQKEARARSETQAREQQLALAQLQRDATEQKRFLEQRFLIVAAAAEQQRRDAQLSMQVARESNQRLREAERTLAEFERINYPLRSVSVSAVIDLNFEGVEMRGLWERLAALPEEHRRPEYRGGPKTVVSFVPSDVGGNPVIAYGTTGTRIRLVFAEAGAEGAGKGGDKDALVRLDDKTNRSGPVEVRLNVERIEANLRTHQATVYYSGSYEPEAEGVVSSGAKLSLSDVDRLMPIVLIERATSNPAGRRPPDTLVSFSYWLNDQQRFGGYGEFRIADEAAFLLQREAGE